MKKKQLLEAILKELQITRSYLEQRDQAAASGWTTTSNHYTFTDGFGGVGGGGGGQGAIKLNITSSDPGADRLQELIDNPHGEEAKRIEEMPVTELEDGETISEQIKQALQQHDQDLVRRIKRL